MGLLSILKSSVRKGHSIVTAPPAEAATALTGDIALEQRLHKWHLNSPWLTAPQGRTCARHWTGSQRCTSGKLRRNAPVPVEL